MLSLFSSHITFCVHSKQLHFVFTCPQKVLPVVLLNIQLLFANLSAATFSTLHCECLHVVFNRNMKMYDFCVCVCIVRQVGILGFRRVTVNDGNESMPRGAFFWSVTKVNRP